MPVKAATKKNAKGSVVESLSGKYKQIQDLVKEVEVDLPKFHDKGNRSAGIRIRKAMQDLKSIAQEIRMMILDASK
jgi:hypothetical protein